MDVRTNVYRMLVGTVLVSSELVAVNTSNNHDFTSPDYLAVYLVPVMVSHLLNRSMSN